MRQYLKNLFKTLHQIITFWPIPVLLLLTVAMSLWGLYSTIDDYKDYVEDINLQHKADILNTLSWEKLNAILEGKTIENTNYSMTGVNIYLVPPPLNIFSLNLSYGTATQGKIRAGYEITIQNVIINIFKDFFSRQFMGLNTFSGVIFYLGSIMFLILGYTAFNIKHASYISTDKKQKLAFFPTVTAALIAVIIIDGILMGLGLLFSHFNGLTFHIDSGIQFIFFSFLLLHCLAICVGALFVTINSALKNLPIMILISFTCMFILTDIFESSFREKQYALETEIAYKQLDQLGIFNKMYRKLLDLGETFGYGYVKSKQVQDIVLDYYKNDYPKIEAIENQFIAKEMEVAAGYRKYVRFFPLNFFSEMNYEITGYGISNNIDFHKHLLQTNRRYLQTVIDKIYFSTEKKIEPFFKENEYFYPSQSYIPGTIYRGTVIIFCYIVVLLTVSYLRLRILLPREIARIKEEAEKEKERQQREIEFQQEIKKWLEQGHVTA